MSPSGFDFGKSVLVLLMVVLGGMGNVWGVTIGALLLAWLNGNGLKQIGVQIDALFGTSLEATLPRYNYIILGLLLVLMMLFRREGLIPEGRTKALMNTPSRTETESLGADIMEAGAETEAFEHSDAEADAKIAASAAATSRRSSRKPCPGGRMSRERVPAKESWPTPPSSAARPTHRTARPAVRTTRARSPGTCPRPVSTRSRPTSSTPTTSPSVSAAWSRSTTCRSPSRRSRWSA